MRERLGGEPRTQRRRGRALVRVELRQHGGVVGGIDHHGHGIMVLGGGAHHRRAADVDVLDGLGVAAGRPRDGLREGVEVDDQEVDAFDAVQRHHALVDAAPA